MGEAKNIIVKPISEKDARKIIADLHYSGKHAINPHINLGVFMNGMCGGVMQFGPSMQKSKIINLVSGTLWNEFIELNRMAFADWIPTNGESRCLGFAMRWIRKTYPHIKWVISFADGTQCGDGTIYRASGFVLTAIKKNSSMWRSKSGEVFCDIGLRASSNILRKRLGYKLGETFSQFRCRTGCERLHGFQLRYLYFLDRSARERLAVPILPFSEIDRLGAGMYLGKPRVRSVDSDTTTNQVDEGGANPTRTL